MREEERDLPIVDEGFECCMFCVDLEAFYQKSWNLLIITCKKTHEQHLVRKEDASWGCPQCRLSRYRCRVSPKLPQSILRIRRIPENQKNVLTTHVGLTASKQTKLDKDLDSNSDSTDKEQIKPKRPKKTAKTISDWKELVQDTIMFNLTTCEDITAQSKKDMIMRVIFGETTDLPDWQSWNTNPEEELTQLEYQQQSEGQLTTSAKRLAWTFGAVFQDPYVRSKFRLLPGQMIYYTTYKDVDKVPTPIAVGNGLRTTIALLFRTPRFELKSNANYRILFYDYSFPVDRVRKLKGDTHFVFPFGGIVPPHHQAQIYNDLINSKGKLTSQQITESDENTPEKEMKIQILPLTQAFIPGSEYSPIPSNFASTLDPTYIREYIQKHDSPKESHPHVPLDARAIYRTISSLIVWQPSGLLKTVWNGYESMIKENLITRNRLPLFMGKTFQPQMPADKFKKLWNTKFHGAISHLLDRLEDFEFRGLFRSYCSFLALFPNEEEGKKEGLEYLLLDREIVAKILTETGIGFENVCPNLLNYIEILLRGRQRPLTEGLSLEWDFYNKLYVILVSLAQMLPLECDESKAAKQKQDAQKQKDEIKTPVKTEEGPELIQENIDDKNCKYQRDFWEVALKILQNELVTTNNVIKEVDINTLFQKIKDRFSSITLLTPEEKEASKPRAYETLILTLGSQMTYLQGYLRTGVFILDKLNLVSNLQFYLEIQYCLHLYYAGDKRVIFGEKGRTKEVLQKVYLSTGISEKTFSTYYLIAEKMIFGRKILNTDKESIVDKDLYENIYRSIMIMRHFWRTHSIALGDPKDGEFIPDYITPDWIGKERTTYPHFEDFENLNITDKRRPGDFRTIGGGKAHIRPVIPDLSAYYTSDSPEDKLNARLLPYVLHRVLSRRWGFYVQNNIVGVNQYLRLNRMTLYEEFIKKTPSKTNTLSHILTPYLVKLAKDEFSAKQHAAQKRVKTYQAIYDVLQKEENAQDLCSFTFNSYVSYSLKAQIKQLSSPLLMDRSNFTMIGNYVRGARRILESTKIDSPNRSENWFMDGFDSELTMALNQCKIGELNQSKIGTIMAELYTVIQDLCKGVWPKEAETEDQASEPKDSENSAKNTPNQINKQETPNTSEQATQPMKYPAVLGYANQNFLLLHLIRAIPIPLGIFPTKMAEKANAIREVIYTSDKFEIYHTQFPDGSTFFEGVPTKGLQLLQAIWYSLALEQLRTIQDLLTKISIPEIDGGIEDGREEGAVENEEDPSNSDLSNDSGQDRSNVPIMQNSPEIQTLSNSERRRATQIRSIAKKYRKFLDLAQLAQYALNHPDSEIFQRIVNLFIFSPTFLPKTKAIEAFALGIKKFMSSREIKQLSANDISPPLIMHPRNWYAELIESFGIYRILTVSAEFSTQQTFIETVTKEWKQIWQSTEGEKFPLPAFPNQEKDDLPFLQALKTEFAAISDRLPDSFLRKLPLQDLRSQVAKLSSKVEIIAFSDPHVRSIPTGEAGQFVEYTKWNAQCEIIKNAPLGTRNYLEFQLKACEALTKSEILAMDSKFFKESDTNLLHDEIDLSPPSWVKQESPNLSESLLHQKIDYVASRNEALKAELKSVNEYLDTNREHMKTLLEGNKDTSTEDTESKPESKAARSGLKTEFYDHIRKATKITRQINKNNTQIMRLGRFREKLLVRTSPTILIKQQKLRTAYTTILKDLTTPQFAELMNYLKGPVIYRIMLSNRIVSQIKAHQPINNVTFITPIAGELKVLANLALDLYSSQMPPIRLVQDLTQSQVHEGGYEKLTFGIDLNRLASNRALCIETSTIETSLETKTIDLKTQEKLLDLWPQKQIQNESHPKTKTQDEKSITQLIWEGFSKPNDKVSFMSQIQAHLNSLRQPTTEEFYNPVAEKRSATFNDQINAPIMVWKIKLDHLEHHIAALQRALTKIKKDPITDKFKKSRLQKEIRLLYARRVAIRQNIIQYLAKVMIYIRLRFNPEYIGYENLDTMSTRGNRGALAKIISEMIKKWDEVRKYCNQWMKPLDHDEFVQVGASGTSQYHIQCKGYTDQALPRRKLIRNTNWDFPYCPMCHTVVDGHVNAARAIAGRGAPKRKKTPRPTLSIKKITP